MILFVVGSILILAFGIGLGLLVATHVNDREASSDPAASIAVEKREAAVAAVRPDPRGLVVVDPERMILVTPRGVEIDLSGGMIDLLDVLEHVNSIESLG